MQRWIHTQGWTTLHDAQEQAIGPILDGRRDLIISAATAAGKTEAAFLPICSALAATRDAAASAPAPDPWAGHDPRADQPTDRAGGGVEVLYLSPLKALINDQFTRLQTLGELVDIAVHRWHGDVAGGAKRLVRENPSGVLLITPESLEATFVNRGSSVPAFLAGLRYVVVDELHSFLASARGAQLQSLLARVELAIRRRPPRIGLSATLGDMAGAARFLRPTDPDRVVLIDSSADKMHLRLQVRGYRTTAPSATATAAAGAGGEAPGKADAEVAAADLGGDRAAIADHVFRTLRGSDNLVFANARSDVEAFADLLRRRCEDAGAPNEFWPHHGSLSKALREDVEAQLKDRTRPATAICTSTLEMGIDIGTVASVAQVGPPPSVASLRQRLGRSGRRGEPAVLRAYITERDLNPRSDPLDELRIHLVQTVSMVELLLDHWVEAPADPGLNLSTLIQQILSTIAQHGGATAKELHGALCGPGPFELVDTSRFARLLRAMAARDLLVQAGDGTILHGGAGERFVNHYDFYTAFATPEEWKLTAGGRHLGNLPISRPLAVGGFLIFGGRRWRVEAVDPKAKLVELSRASGGVLPSFGSDGPLVGDGVRARMAQVYAAADVPAWLDPNAKALLAEGRAAWSRHGLATTVLLDLGSATMALPWVGDRALTTAAFVLSSHGLQVHTQGPALVVSGLAPADLAGRCADLAAGPQPDSLTLARTLDNTEVDKWDWVLDEDLAAEAAAARLLDIDGAWKLFGNCATR